MTGSCEWQHWRVEYLSHSVFCWADAGSSAKTITAQHDTTTALHYSPEQACEIAMSDALFVNREHVGQGGLMPLERFQCCNSISKMADIKLVSGSSYSSRRPWHCEVDVKGNFEFLCTVNVAIRRGIGNDCLCKREIRSRLLYRGKWLWAVPWVIHMNNTCLTKCHSVCDSNFLTLYVSQSRKT